jgi:hypothetical protein
MTFILNSASLLPPPRQIAAAPEVIAAKDESLPKAVLANTL